MQRYFTTLRVFWGASVATEAEYRINFVLAVLNSLLNLGGSLFGLFLFYRTGYQPGGWPWEAALVVLGIYTVMDGMYGTFLAPNLSRIVQLIQDGTLDFVLLKPMDSQFWLSARNLSLWGLPNVAFGLVMIGYAAVKLGVTAGALAHGLLFFIPGLLVLYSLWFILGTFSIWFVKIYNVTFVLRSILEAGKYPLDAYPAGFRFFFTFLIPVAFLTTIPARAVTGGGLDPVLLGAAFALGVALLAVSRAFWRFALRFYTSASS